MTTLDVIVNAADRYTPVLHIHSLILFACWYQHRWHASRTRICQSRAASTACCARACRHVYLDIQITLSAGAFPILNIVDQHVSWHRAIYRHRQLHILATQAGFNCQRCAGRYSTALNTSTGCQQARSSRTCHGRRRQQQRLFLLSRLCSPVPDAQV